MKTNTSNHKICFYISRPESFKFKKGKHKFWQNLYFFLALINSLKVSTFILVNENCNWKKVLIKFFVSLGNIFDILNLCFHLF